MHDTRPLIMLIFILVLLFLLLVTAKQNRRHTAMADRKQCRQCGARFGIEAQYCGRCGHAL
jgi:ribosomal protein L40E